MKLPDHIAKIIEPAPEGYSWEYRGRYWKAKGVCYVYYIDETIIGYGGLLCFGQHANGTNVEYIELVKIPIDMTTPQGQLAYAESLVGEYVTGFNTNITFDNYKGVVAGFKFIDNTSADYQNRVVKSSMKKGWTVVVWMENDESRLPVEFAKAIKSKTIKLTENYDVKIFKDKVEVGCQTITKEKLCEVLAEMEKLS